MCGRGIFVRAMQRSRLLRDQMPSTPAMLTTPSQPAAGLRHQVRFMPRWARPCCSYQASACRWTPRTHRSEFLLPHALYAETRRDAPGSLWPGSCARSPALPKEADRLDRRTSDSHPVPHPAPAFRDTYSSLSRRAPIIRVCFRCMMLNAGKELLAAPQRALHRNTRHLKLSLGKRGLRIKGRRGCFGSLLPGALRARSRDGSHSARDSLSGQPDQLLGDNQPRLDPPTPPVPRLAHDRPIENFEDKVLERFLFPGPARRIATPPAPQRDAIGGRRYPTS